MPKVVHVIGNGDQACLYEREPRKGLKLACNQTPFDIPDKWATVMVDFKFMNAMKDGYVNVSGNWVCGYRPQRWCNDNPNWYMKWASQIREFYTELPQYVVAGANGNVGMGYTNFNCGHVAVHYACNKLKADVVHMYGFDSIFDWNPRSFSDLVLNSDRGNTNNHRLIGNWRPIWTRMWDEFPETKFILHHTHNKFKVKHGDNVEARVYEKTKAEPEVLDPNKFSSA